MTEVFSCGLIEPRVDLAASVVAPMLKNITEGDAGLCGIYLEH